MENSQIFLKKMYDLRDRTEGANYLTKNAVANMVKKKHGIKLERKEIRDILDDLVNKGLIEKTRNGIRISGLGIQFFDEKSLKPKKSKGFKKVIFTTLVIVALVITLYYLYI